MERYSIFFWSIYFCGGDCIEDLSGNFNHHLRQNPFLKIPSPDRVLERFKKLSFLKKIFLYLEVSVIMNLVLMIHLTNLIF